MQRDFRRHPEEYDSNRRPSSRSEQSDGEDGRTGLSRGEVDLYLLVDWKQCPLIATEVERAGRAVAGQRNDCYRHATATAGRKLHDADCSRCRLRAGVDGTAHKDVAAGNCHEETGNHKNDKEAIHRAPPTWYVQGRPPLHQEVYTCALAPVVMEIVQTLALAQDADELFLCQESSGLEEIRQRLQCRGGIDNNRQRSGRTGAYRRCFRNRRRSKVVDGAQGAQHLQQPHAVFVGSFPERETDAETWIAHAHVHLHVSSYPVQLEFQVHIRAYGEGRHQFHVASMLADVGQRAPGADVAALHPKLCAARTFVAWTLPSLAAPCGRGFCRRASFWLREPGRMLVPLQPPKIVRSTAVKTHRILSQPSSALLSRVLANGRGRLPHRQ